MASRTAMLPALLARSSRPAIRAAGRTRSRPAVSAPRHLLSTSAALRKQALPPAQEPAPSSPLSPAPAWLHEKVGTAALWLRDSCRCALCVSPSSGQKSFATPDIPASVRPSAVQVSAAGDLTVRWEDDVPGAAERGHVSVYPAAYLDSLKFRAAGAAASAEGPADDFSVVDRTVPYRTWDAARIKREVRTLEYADFMGSEDGLWAALFDLEALGLVFLKNVPREEGAVAEVGQRVANLQETFYGRTWDVVSKPDAENVAYTSAYLGLHEDMLYVQQPPRVQLLHCIENSCDGGESIFSDATHAARAMIDDPAEAAAVEALSGYGVRYHYDKHPFFYRRSRPVFEMREGDEVGEGATGGGGRELVNVWWSPPFQAPNPPAVDDAGHAAHRAWQAATKRFEGILSAEENVYEVKLEPGECVLFDNRRVLHGRNAFNTGSGSRWLRGTYISDEDFRSKMRSADRKAVERYAWERGLELGGRRLRDADERMAGFGSLGMWLRAPGGLPREALEGRLGL